MEQNGNPPDECDDRGSPPPLPRVPPTAADHPFTALARYIVRRNPAYLLSAVLLILGVYTIVEPGKQAVGNVSAVLATFSTVQLYELLVVGIALFLVCCRRVLDDGATLVLIEALFVIACFVLADELTFKADHMALGMLLGLAALALATARLAALGLAVGRRFPSSLLGVLVFALLLWNAGAPGPLARLLEANSAHLTAAYLLGWWAVAAAGLGLALYASREPVRLWPPGQPFVRSPIARWAIAGIVLGATALHQYWIGYILDASRQLADLLPLAAVAALGVLNLLAADRDRATASDYVVAGVPGALCVLALVSGAFAPLSPPPSVPGIRQAFAHELRTLTWPTAWLGVAAAIAALHAWRRRSVGLAHEAAAMLLLAALFSTARSPETVEVTWDTFELALAAYCLVMSVATAGPGWAAGCLATLNHLAWRNWPADPVLGVYIAPGHGVMAAVGASFFVLWLIFRRRLKPSVAHVGSALMLVATLAIDFSPLTRAPGWFLNAGTLCLAACFVLAAWAFRWRTYYGLGLLTATLPLAREVHRWGASLGSPTGWVLVLGAFVALGLGFLVSTRKGAHTLRGQP